MTASRDGGGWYALVLRGVLVCVVVKLLTWGVGYVLACTAPFDRREYFGNYGHYLLDTRAARPDAPGFFEVWNYSDSEWYLTLAAEGYPDLRADPKCGSDVRQQWSTEKHCSHKYAFFPLYPMTIAAFAPVFPLTAAAFVATALLGLGAAAALMALCRRCFPARDREAVAGVILLFLYPFAIFYQLYFSESLFLLLSVVAFLCAWQQRYLPMLLAGALLASTRPLGVLIAMPLLVAVLETTSRAERQVRLRGWACALLVPLGLLPFAYLNFVRTGDWHYFSTVQQLWGYENVAWPANLWRNVVGTGRVFAELPFHRFHKSQLDYLVMLVFGVVLAFMWRERRFPRALTLWSTLLWLAPLASKDLMSFGRYMSVAFPVFMYAALHLPGRVRTVLTVVFAAGYLAALYGIMTYAWVG